MPDTTLPSGHYFDHVTRRFGLYTNAGPDQGDGSEPSYFKANRDVDGLAHSTVHVFKAEEAPGRLVKVGKAFYSTLNAEVYVVPVLDGDDVIVLPMAWTEAMVTDPNFRLTKAEQQERLTQT